MSWIPTEIWNMNQTRQKKQHLRTRIPEPSTARVNMMEMKADVTFSDGSAVKVYETMVCVR